MSEARFVRSIHELGREAWDRCFPGALEGYDYLAAVEDAGLEGFDWRYGVVEEDRRILAAVPAFFTDYPLDTTLNPLGRRLIAATRRVAARAFTVRLASLGSPCTETVGLGFAPEVSAQARPRLLAGLLQAFEQAAAAEDCWLLSIKDAPTRDGQVWRAAAPGYRAVPGMPSASLRIDFPDLDGYLATLSAGARKDLRRKLKSLAKLRIEVRRDLAGLEARVLQLYAETRERSDLQFEDLTAAYFTGVLERMPERAFCVLYFAGDELIGANLLLQDAGRLLDKFFCMETARGPAHDLYFVSWLTNVRLCLERGLEYYQSGQAGYAAKLRLGSRLEGAETYFRHRRPIVNRALQWAAPLLAEDPAPLRGAA